MAVAIAQTTLIMSLFFMFVTTAFVANVIVRDDEVAAFDEWDAHLAGEKDVLEVKVRRRPAGLELRLDALMELGDVLRFVQAAGDDADQGHAAAS